MSVQIITQENFAQLKNSGKTILLDFYADWCGPCRMVAPIIEEIAAEKEDIIVGKINVDKEPALAQAFGVVSIPTLAVLKGDAVIHKAVGAMPKDDILALLEG